MTKQALATYLRICARAFLATALACALVPALAFAQTPDTDTDAPTYQRIVKVGYMSNPGNLSKNDDGTFEGYTYDYLMRVAQFTGWTFEFVEAPGETGDEQAIALMDMIGNATVDIAGGMTYSAALSDLYEYPENSYGAAHTSLFAPNVDASVSQTNLFTQEELRVAILSTAKQRRAELEYYCNQNGINLITVECTTTEEMRGKTLSGEADVFLEIDVNIFDGFHIVSSFAGRPFFFAAPMSEGLFLLCCAGCLYLVRRGRTGLGCLVGGYAAFTRSLGLMLFAPVFFELVQEKRGWRRFLWLVLIPAGFGAYCFINWQVSGDPFKYMEYQKVHWGQSLGFFFNTAAYQLENAIAYLAEGRSTAWGLWIPNLVCSFFALGVMAPAAKRLRPSYTAWFIAYYAVAIGATWLLSAPRYLVAMPVIALALALDVQQKNERALLCALLPASLCYLLAFCLGLQVW